MAGVSSTFLEVTKGVPQDSVFGPILFTVHMNDLSTNLPNASYRLYADDSVIYCWSYWMAQAFEFLQSAFDAVQIHLGKLKLVLQIYLLKNPNYCSFQIHLFLQRISRQLELSMVNLRAGH